MKPTQKTEAQSSFLLPDLAAQLDPRHELSRLAGQINWSGFEESFGPLYSAEGRPALPIRRMVGLLILKQLYNLSDERVVEFWTLSGYAQLFCGENQLQWGVPCEPSELVHFRHRIGPDGAERILQASIALHGPRAKEKEVVVDTTAQEKAITFPTDTKLHAKIVRLGVKISKKAGIELRQSYGRTVPKLLQAQRGRRHPRTRQAALKAARRLKTIAGRVVRELERKLTTGHRWTEVLALCRRVLAQQRQDHAKVYSLHEPQVYCLAKGKEHKEYEFGAKASLVVGKRHGVTFRKITRGIAGNGARPRPRWPDFRHSFASRLVAKWGRQAEPVAHHLLFLSRYLGHKSFRETWWYISPSPDALQAASSRFHAYQLNSPNL